MPPQLEPLNLYADMQEKSWWRRLLGQ
jgi:protein-tyrosine phosphatase